MQTNEKFCTMNAINLLTGVMDTKLVETFLEIVATGSFNTAAAQMNIGQTTVSARIRTLEDQLERPLFVRHKGGAALTPAGRQFLRHAPNFVQLARQMRRQVAVPQGHRAILAIGGEMSLWQPLLLDWIRRLRAECPDIALRVQVDAPGTLIDQVAAGLVDAAVIHAPPQRPGLRIDLLADDRLVLASTDPAADPANGQTLVGADWGPDFSQGFVSGFPAFQGAGVTFDPGPLAADYILAAGGSGYFRQRDIAPHLASGALHLVQDAPQFPYPVCAVSSSQADPDLLGPALSHLRKVAPSG